MKKKKAKKIRKHLNRISLGLWTEDFGESKTIVKIAELLRLEGHLEVRSPGQNSLLKQGHLELEGLGQMILKVSSNQNHAMILWLVILLSVCMENV